MTAVVYILFLASLFWIQEMESTSDANRITENKPINHRDELIERTVLGAICFLGTILLIRDWKVLWLAPAGWGWFTMWFRYRLNKKRDLDWRYISPSNGYDWQFIRIAWFNGFSRALSISEAKEYHEEFYVPSGRNDQYQPAVHRAGTIAYAFEALTFLLGSTLFFL